MARMAWCASGDGAATAAIATRWQRPLRAEAKLTARRAFGGVKGREGVVVTDRR